MNGILKFFYKKYIFSKNNEFLNSDTFLLVVGIVISVMVLTFSNSIFDGYIKQLKKVILGVNSHIYFFKDSSSDLTKNDYRVISDFLSSQKEVISFSPIIQANLMVSANGRVVGCQLQGIDTKSKELPFTYHKFVRDGKSVLDNPDEIVIGKYIAEQLQVHLGDKIKLISPLHTNFSLMGINQQQKEMTVVGIYDSGMYQYDSSMIFSQLDTARQFSKEKSEYTLIGVKIKDEYLEKVSYLTYVWENNDSLYSYQILDWTDFNSSLFETLEFSRWILFFIMSIIIFVASFNVISAVSTMIIDKKEEISILKTMGLKNKELFMIFFGKTFFIASSAIFLGLLFGFCLSLIAHYQTFYSLNPKAYLVDKIYIHFDIFSILLIILVSHIIVLLSAIIPLRNLNKLSIIKILREKN